MVPLARIAIGYNPRRYFDSKKHDELVASLRLRGMLQPILVRPADDGKDRYIIVAGGRRYRAALEAFGADGEAPVIIREMTDQEALEAAIDENDIRDDASETEQADAAVRVLAACQNDRGEAGRRLGWSRAKLDRRLALANLSDAVKLALDKRRIKVGHAELLAAVPADKQDKALETILGAGLDIGKTRDLLMRVTQNLADACFDKSECTTCPFNSGTQRALFETHVDDGHCTNAACFQLKTDAVEQARQEKQDRSAAADDTPDEGDLAEADEAEDQEDERADGVEATARRAALAPGTPSGRATVRSNANANGPSVTAKSIAGRTSDLREATWRTALARGLADNAFDARTAILVAALTGTLSQIKSGTLPDEKNAWHFDGATLHEYLPDLEECSSLPPLTLVPVEQFAREVDDVARHGMEYGFMDIAGLCPLPDAARVTDWFASLEAGARLLLAAQELIQLDPDTL